ncbi:MAG: hypothetical protein ACFE85_16815 [Candidatus Hodarchaeota archaeon]
MFSFISIEFSVAFLLLLSGLSSVNIIFWTFRIQWYNRVEIKILMRTLLFVAFTILIVDSIPYLYTDIYTISPINIVLSNMFLLLFCLSIIFYGILLVDLKKGKEDLES